MIDKARLHKASSEIVGALVRQNPLAAIWADNLAGLADALGHKITVDAARPTKSELRKQIEGLSAAIGVLEDSLSNVTLLELLHPRMVGGLAEVGPMMVTLRRYKQAADIVASEIPTTPGPGKAKVAENLLDARAWCALLICETWILAKGDPPGATNDAAHAAAEKLWASITGEPQADTLDRWKRPFERARQCDDWQMQHVREHLSLKPLDLSSVRSENL